MDLVKNRWEKTDVKVFTDYLLSLGRAEKVAWTQRIINTQQPVLAIPTPTLRAIAKAIRRGNYQSFLDLGIFATYESTVIHGLIVAQITDLALLEKYLVAYAAHVDNWAACDLLSFKVKGQEAGFLQLAKRCVKAENLFLRRIGLIILFKLVDTPYLADIFAIIASLQNESAYYVNMAVAWLLCDCFIKQRDQTWAFWQTHTLNPFVARKFVSKCRDSYRVSAADKQMLRDYLRSKAL